MPKLPITDTHEMRGKFLRDFSGFNVLTGLGVNGNDKAKATFFMAVLDRHTSESAICVHP